MNSKSLNSKEKLEKRIEKITDAIRYANKYKEYIKDQIKNTPLQIKILNITVPMALTYFFTIIYYNLPVSITFAILTFFAIFILNLPCAIIFLIFYISIVSNKYNSINKVLGTPIPETDIVKNSSPFICTANSLIVDANTLSKNLSSLGGYFTYSFWLYLNGNKNDINNDENWYSYRYKEWKSIFYRGDVMTDDLSNLTQFPGFWLTPVLNNMVIVFQNGTTIERIEIIGIPLNTWINYSVVVESKSVSIYINGLLDNSVNLSQTIINPSNYPLYISNDKKVSIQGNQSGFAGSIAELVYFNYSLTQLDIQNMYNYYKKIIDNYQKNQISKYQYTTSSLITNSDIK